MKQGSPQGDVRFTRGFRLGVYEVIAPIATGGMGEVYRARDTTLGRDVALKVLTRDASDDPERKARFEREARAVATLSHPNILTIYSFGTENGVAYAAMELLEGRSLREELAQGPLPVRSVTRWGSQMALGLAAAHEKNIIHRDLKPENVFVTPDGRVKLLDFGLAKIASDQQSVFATGDTQAGAITGAGMLMGSLGYMSPEQLSGSVTDSRSDVFSLGIVLFEMLTGRLPFWRDSPAEAFTATLKEDTPAIADVRPGVPPPLERIVRRCLEKSPSERFQSARDLAFSLLAFVVPSTGTPETVVPESGMVERNRRRFIAATALVAGVSAAAIGAGYWARPTPHPHPLVTFTIPGPPGTALANVPSKMLAISPDAERVVFAVERGGHRELWIRQLDAVDAVPLRGTQDASEPFWSPDGQHVGFFADSKLKRVAVDGTMPVIVCDAPPEARGAAWSPAGIILFSDANGGLSRVSDTGGVPTPVTMPDREAGRESDGWPQFLPDGRRFLYLRQGGPSAGRVCWTGTRSGDT